MRKFLFLFLLFCIGIMNNAWGSMKEIYFRVLPQMSIVVMRIALILILIVLLVFSFLYKSKKYICFREKIIVLGCFISFVIISSTIIFVKINGFETVFGIIYPSTIVRIFDFTEW